MQELRLRCAWMMLLAACAGPDGEAEGEVVEVRVDHPDSSSASNDIRPRLCADGSKLHVVWQDLREGESAVWYNRSDDGGETWLDSDERLDDGVASAESPAIACAEDRVYVVWLDAGHDETGGDNGLQVRASTDGGQNFEPSFWLDGETDEAYGALSPVIAARGASVAVAWADGRNGAYDIFVNVSTDSATTWFVSPVRVDGGEAGEAWSAVPQIAVSDDGGVVVAWEDGRDAVADVYLAMSGDYGQSFADPVQLDESLAAGGESMQPSLAMAGSAVGVAWHEGDGAGWSVVVTQSSDGGETWSAAELVSDLEYEAFEVALAWGEGRIHVGWHERHGDAYDVMVATDFGSGWNAPQQIDTNGWGTTDAYEVRLLAGEGELLAAWHDRRYDTAEVGMNDLFFNRSVDGGATWLDEDIRLNGGDPGNSYALGCQIARDGDRFFGIWEDGRFGFSGVVSVVRDLSEVGDDE